MRIARAYRISRARNPAVPINSIYRRENYWPGQLFRAPGPAGFRDPRIFLLIVFLDPLVLFSFKSGGCILHL